jgi:hypothetical protein
VGRCSSTCGAPAASPVTARLIDSNTDLIGCYQMILDLVDEVAEALDALAAGHAKEGKAIYLNRTGFNGLYRVNARGEFNVAAGRYDQPRIVDRDRLRRVAAAIGHPDVRVTFGTFTDALERAVTGDFLYIDPPYAPVSATASFSVIHERAVRRRRSGTTPAGGDRSGAARLPGADQQFDCPVDRPALSWQPGGTGRRSPRVLRASPPRRQQRGIAPRRHRGVLDYERPGLTAPPLVARVRRATPAHDIPDRRRPFAGR